MARPTLPSDITTRSTDRNKATEQINVEPVITQWEWTDHGIQSEQYFAGLGVGPSAWQECVSGIGDSEREAMDDVLEQLATIGYTIKPKLEKELEDADEENVCQDSDPETHYYVSLRFKYEVNPEPTKIEALANYLECDEEDLIENSYDVSLFDLGSHEYMVLTDAEADERAKDYIEQSLWAFNASFLASYTDLPEEVFTALQERYEDANDAILKLIERTDDGLDGFVSEAISADGRGHFMSNYDGCENEQGEFYIYRMN